MLSEAPTLVLNSITGGNEARLRLASDYDAAEVHASSMIQQQEAINQNVSDMGQTEIALQNQQLGIYSANSEQRQELL